MLDFPTQKEIEEELAKGGDPQWIEGFYGCIRWLRSRGKNADHDPAIAEARQRDFTSQAQARGAQEDQRMLNILAKHKRGY